MTLCPDGGKCGAKSHIVGSERYKECLKTSQGRGAQAQPAPVVATAPVTTVGGSTTDDGWGAEYREVKGSEIFARTEDDCVTAVFGIDGLDPDRLEYEEQYAGYALAKGIESATGHSFRMEVTKEVVDVPVHNGRIPEVNLKVYMGNQVTGEFEGSYHMQSAQQNFSPLDVLSSVCEDDRMLDACDWEMFGNLDTLRAVVKQRQEFESAFGMKPTEMYNRFADPDHELYTGYGKENYASPELPWWATYDTENMIHNSRLTSNIGSSLGNMRPGELGVFPELRIIDELSTDEEKYLSDVLGDTQLRQRFEGFTDDGDRHFTIEFAHPSGSFQMPFIASEHTKLGDQKELTARNILGTIKAAQMVRASTFEEDYGDSWEAFGSFGEYAEAKVMYEAHERLYEFLRYRTNIDSFNIEDMK